MSRHHSTHILYLAIVICLSFCCQDAFANSSEFDNALKLLEEEMDTISLDGNSANHVEVGNSYFDKKMYGKAREAYEIAASYNDAIAQNKLGNIYHEGLGVKRDLYKAKNYYELSARNGNKYAQYNLGNAYYHGEGCQKNLDEAFRWLKISCEAGYKKACEGHAYISKKTPTPIASGNGINTNQMLLNNGSRHRQANSTKPVRNSSKNDMGELIIEKAKDAAIDKAVDIGVRWLLKKFVK